MVVLEGTVYRKGLNLIAYMRKPFTLTFRGIHILVLMQFYCSSLQARPTTIYQAEKVTGGWLKVDAKHLGMSLGQQVMNVETFSDTEGQPIYHIVYLQPSGFVVVSADDLIEPIIAFADDGFFDPSVDNPFGVLVNQDLNGRVAAVRQAQSLKGVVRYGAVPSPQTKWKQLESLAETQEGQLAIMSLSTISDVRVAPLVQSKWGQEDVCGENCYNCYTPENYPCGCFSTAITQLMKFYEYPSYGIGVHNLEVFVDDVPRSYNTRGGDGIGGPYNWNLMELVPNCSTTSAQREAIGALCYDVGLAARTHYSSSGGAVYFDQREAIGNNLKNIFGYSNGIYGCNGCAQGNFNDIGVGLAGMVNPNLDAGYPIVLTVHHTSWGLGHAILCDGYGYDYSTLYHHLNMGWDGIDDAWYNLPTIDSSPSYNTVNGCLYNIYTSGSGEIISGRITDSAGNAISGATVTAQITGGETYTAITNSKGIYALSKVPSASTYTISVTKISYSFDDKSVTTGTSVDTGSASGNRLGIDFQGNEVTVVGDFCGAEFGPPDGYVDVWDLMQFADHWHSRTGEDNWDAKFDLKGPNFGDPDAYVDVWDLMVFADNWHKGVKQ